jgi:hypothetical protein
MTVNSAHQALQTILEEVKHIDREITSTFIFKGNGVTVAADGNTKVDQTKTFIDQFERLNAQAEAIGYIESLTIQGSDCQLSTSAINRLYLTSVCSQAANKKTVKALTCVLIPTVIRLIDEFAPGTEESQVCQQSSVVQTENGTIQENELPVDETAPIDETAPREPDPGPQPPLGPQPLFKQSSATQFMVERIVGLFVAGDTVRVDGEVIAKWNELNQGKAVTEVNVETLEGKTLTCKCRPIKDSKLSQGIVQMPERILQLLETGKGKLVMVKPIVEAEA